MPPLVLADDPQKTIEEALARADECGGDAGVLRWASEAIVSDCRALLAEAKPQPVHGELGPWALLRNPNGLGPSVSAGAA